MDENICPRERQVNMYIHFIFKEETDKVFIPFK